MGGRGGSSGLNSASGRTKSQKVDFSGLPELQGSEKQVKWAEQIRSNVINTINNNIERMEKSENRSYYKPSIDAFKEIGEKVNAMLRQPPGVKASNIIDKRNSALDVDRILSMVHDLERKKRSEKK